MSQVELQRTHGQWTYHQLKVDHSVFRGSAVLVMNSKHQSPISLHYLGSTSPNICWHIGCQEILHP